MTRNTYYITPLKNRTKITKGTPKERKGKKLTEKQQQKLIKWICLVRRR